MCFDNETSWLLLDAAACLEDCWRGEDDGKIKRKMEMELSVKTREFVLGEEGIGNASFNLGCLPVDSVLNSDAPSFWSAEPNAGMVCLDCKLSYIEDDLGNANSWFIAFSKLGEEELEVESLLADEKGGELNG